MNIGEANAVNLLLDYIATPARSQGGRLVTRDTAIKAAQLLTKGSHRALMAGYRPDNVAQAFPNR